jgi:glycosyltransferase involved in cell wall biosynthesis
MPLGLLIPEFPTQTHAFFWREILALRSFGAEVHILSTRRPSEPCPHQFAPEATAQTHYLYPPKVSSVLAALRPASLKCGREYVHGLSEQPFGITRSWAFIVCAADLVEHARRLGIVHVHVHSFAQAAHIAALAQQMGGPSYSLHLHGHLEVYGGDHRQKVKNASFLAADARPIQEQLLNQTGFEPSRVHRIWMGVDTALFRPPPTHKRAGPLRLVTVARLNRTKGHRYALAALRRILDEGGDVHYSIVGGGPYLSMVEAAIDEFRVRDHVTMMGSLDTECNRQVLQECDAFILPSFGLGEAFPVAMMEAMSCGVPAISSIIGGTPDMITDGVEGFLVPQMDEVAIAQAIRKLHESEELRARLGAAARQRALAMFDGRTQARRLLDVISSTTDDGAL